MADVTGSKSGPPESKSFKGGWTLGIWLAMIMGGYRAYDRTPARPTPPSPIRYYTDPSRPGHGYFSD